MKREMQVFAMMALLVVVYFTGGDLLNPDFTKEPETTESPAKEIAVAKASSEKEKEAEKAPEPKVVEEKEVPEVPPTKTAEPEVKDTSIVEEAPNSEKTDAEEQKAKELAAQRKAEAEEAERIRLAKERQKALQAQKAKAATPAVDYTVEPETTMDEWADLSEEAKQTLVAHSVQYVIHSQKVNNTPVEALFTTEEFVEAVNDRYAEIDNLTDSFERHRMMGTTVAGQISIMGNRFEFTF